MKSKTYRGGLVLSRKVGEAIYLKIRDVEGEIVRIDVRELKGNQVRVGIMADADIVEIRRGESFEKKETLQ